MHFFDFFEDEKKKGFSDFDFNFEIFNFEQSEMRRFLAFFLKYFLLQVFLSFILVFWLKFGCYRFRLAVMLSAGPVQCYSRSWALN